MPKNPDLIERLYEGLGVHLERTFLGSNLLLHAGAIALTYFFVTEGWDWNFYKWTGQSSAGIQFAFTAAVVGIILPILIPVCLYLYGLMKRNASIKHVALVLMQAVIIALIVSCGYKALTGRVSPEYTVSFSKTSPHTLHRDRSEMWRFGFMRGGVFDGWPSGHTTSAFAMVTAAALVSPRRKWLHIFLFVYAIYIGLGVGTTIHWLSDALAGALIGIAVGRAVAGHE